MEWQHTPCQIPAMLNFSHPHRRLAMQDTFINPFTDFGFKKLFGEEPNKDLLISFLNTLLPQRHQIQDLQYTKNEYQGAGRRHGQSGRAHPSLHR